MAGEKNGSFRRTMLELVLVTGIFAVVSVFLLRFYLTANRLQEKAVAISSSLVRAESLAETVKAYGIEYAVERFGLRPQGNGYLAEYDENWNPSESDGKYLLVLQLESEKSGLLKATVYAGTDRLAEQLQGGAVSEEDIYCELPIASYGEME